MAELVRKVILNHSRQQVTWSLMLSMVLAGFVIANVVQHERLRYKNTFKDPTEVVRYYVNRDASGFVWSGLLDIERRAFTTWSSKPQQDTFFIANDFVISEQKRKLASTAKTASVMVTYDLSGMGDAHGTRMPAPMKKHRVEFKLKKSAGSWKIYSPSAKEISPVVLKARFPYL